MDDSELEEFIFLSFLDFLKIKHVEMEPFKKKFSDRLITCDQSWLQEQFLIQLFLVIFLAGQF